MKRPRRHLPAVFAHLTFVVPPVVALGLFFGAIFWVVLPQVRTMLMEDKRELIRELTEAAWCILEESEEMIRSGAQTPDQARAAAVARIKGLRYGREMKDYFWVMDSAPTMIVHPYRPELNGQPLGNYRDPDGKRLFVELAALAMREDEGFLQYLWQWKDDPDRISPKLSYVKRFEPWGWIIGTGVYLDDVDAEIAHLTRRIVNAGIAVTLATACILAFTAHASITTETRRRRAVDALREARDKYQALAESSREAVVVVLGGRYNYANPALLEALGYSEAAFRKRKLTDLLVADIDSDPMRYLRDLLKGKAEAEQVEATLRRRDGSCFPALLQVSKLTVGAQQGYVISVRQLDPDQVRGQIRQQARQLAEKDRLIEKLHRGAAADAPPPCPADAPAAARWRRNRLAALESRLAAGLGFEAFTTGTVEATDALTVTLIDNAIRDLGPPPAPFTFLCLGSEGRGEMLLNSDQDNAIAYRPDNDANPERCHDYFRKLGEQVCHGLDEAGLPLCEGNVMAMNPRWCADLETWQETFRDWIALPDAQALLEVNIFFDFRPVYGDTSVATTMRNAIFRRVDGHPEFFLHFVENCLLYRAPLGLFGNIVIEEKPDRPGTFSIKDAVYPLVQFARVYAMKHHLAAVNTLERIKQLTDHGHLPETTRREFNEVYTYLMQTRLRHQWLQRRQGRDPDNHIAPANLTNFERSMLKRALGEISSFQTKLSYDFKGVAT